jgi:hypothetical protein
MTADGCVRRKIRPVAIERIKRGSTSKLLRPL